MFEAERGLGDPTKYIFLDYQPFPSVPFYDNLDRGYFKGYDYQIRVSNRSFLCNHFKELITKAPSVGIP